MAILVTLPRRAWMQMELEAQLRNRLDQAIPGTENRARLPQGRAEPAGRRMAAIPRAVE